MTVIDTYVQNLYAEQRKALHEQRGVLDSAAKDKRALSAEESAVVARTDEAFDKLGEEIKGWQERKQRDAEHEIAAEAYAPIVDAQGAKKDEEFSHLVDFMRGARPGNANQGKAFDIDITAAAKERRAIRAGAGPADIRNALSSQTAAAGGNLVPTDFVRSLYNYMEVWAGVRKVANVITTEGGNPLEFPKVTYGGTAAIVGEGTAVAGTDPTFGKMTLNSWKYGELVRVPVELLQDAGVDVEGYLAENFGIAIGRASNVGYTTGTGTNEPEGYMAVCGTAVTGANGGTGIFTFDDLLDLEYSVNSAYAGAGAAWTMKRATIGRARKLKDTDGQYLWQPSGVAGEPGLLDGYPVIENPAMASVGTSLLSVAFGWFPAFYIRDVGSIRVSRSDDRYFDTDEVAWKATLRTDSGLIDLTGAIKAYRGGTA